MFRSCVQREILAFVHFLKRNKGLYDIGFYVILFLILKYVYGHKYYDTFQMRISEIFKYSLIREAFAYLYLSDYYPFGLGLQTILDPNEKNVHPDFGSKFEEMVIRVLVSVPFNTFISNNFFPR